MQVYSSLSGIPFYAPSAGYAPTNSADVSAIASAYQVVSSTATQPYAGTAYVTSINEAPVSAARAGNAANASLANSAWYDGTGRLISALPDSASVSSIASSYVESGVSSKQDTLSFAYNTADQISSINGSALGGMDEAAVSGIASAYAESAVSAASSNYYPATSNPSGYLTAQAQASWSESASASPSYIVDKPDLVDIVAGPGIVIDNPDGNTLRVSVAQADRVELYSSTFANAGGDITLSETSDHFETLEISWLLESASLVYTPITTTVIDLVAYRAMPAAFTELISIFTPNGATGTDGRDIIRNVSIVINGTSIDITAAKAVTLGTSYTAPTQMSISGAKILRVVGCHRIANN